MALRKAKMQDLIDKCAAEAKAKEEAATKAEKVSKAAIMEAAAKPPSKTKRTAQNTTKRGVKRTRYGNPEPDTCSEILY